MIERCRDTAGNVYRVYTSGITVIHTAGDSLGCGDTRGGRGAAHTGQVVAQVMPGPWPEVLKT